MSTVGIEQHTNVHASGSAGAPAKAVAKQFNMQPTAQDAPKYKWSKITPLTGANFVNMGVGSTAEILFEIPTKVHNLSQSILSYMKSILAQGANQFAFDWADTLAELYQVQLQTRGGIDLINMTNANVMLKVMASKELKATEVMEQDDADLVKPCRTASTSNYTPTSGLGSVTGSMDTIEKKYLHTSAVNTQFDRLVTVRLGQFVNTHFAIDKDLVYPEILVLRLVFMSNKAGFIGTAANNPTTAAADLAFGVNLTNLALYLAVEQRPDRVAASNAAMKAGMEIWVPYTWVYKQTISGTQQTVTKYLDSSQGSYLRKAVTVCLGQNENKNVAFDHSNLGADVNTALRVQTFHSELDSERLQEFDYTPTPAVATDFLEAKQNLKGSILQGRTQFYRNWYFCDNWIPESPDTGMKGGDALGGVDIVSKQRKYDFVGVSMVNGTYNWYQFFVTSRLLRISPTELVFIAKK